MPKKSTDTTPAKLRPYISHGMDVSYRDGDTEAISDCPWCGGENKFSIKITTGQCRCLKPSCDFSGNEYSFIGKLMEVSHEATDWKDYEELAESRKLEPDTLMTWGVCKSVINGQWLVPAHTPNSKSKHPKAYRYNKGKLWATSGHKHAVHGLDLYNKKKGSLFICEGPWDAMALWETLRKCKEGDDGLTPTANRKENLLTGCSVIAMPGCNVFPASWAKLAEGKTVFLMYDSDHPKTNKETNKKQTAVGYAAMKRVTGILSSQKDKPAEIHYLKWGRRGFDPKLDDGTDVRDYINPNGKPVDDVPTYKLNQLQSLLSKTVPVPEKWLKAEVEKADGLDTLTCTSYEQLITSWRVALRWSDGLDKALSVMLASIASTRAVGDQLWIKVIGPASCGKSTLCEALSVSKKYTLAKSTIKGFHSGFKTDADGKEDHSLISKISGKTLIVKDGDTLLQAGNLGEILSQARDLYDGVSRSHYNNSIDREYNAIRMTWLLCGTSSLRSIDQSELGERFLDCVIMEGIDDREEDKILWHVAKQAAANLGLEADEQTKNQYNSKLREAMQLTGGYVDYLRDNAIESLVKVGVSTNVLRACINLGKFVAYTRARPSSRQEETAEREFGARLVTQLLRLAVCLAFVLNKSRVDDEVLHRVKQVAFDTARGRTLSIIEHLHENNEKGCSKGNVGVGASLNETETDKLLKFLKKIKAVKFIPEQIGRKKVVKWKLTNRLYRLYSTVSEL